MMERYCEGERFSDLSFTEEAFESCDFTDCVFVDCTFAKCELDHTTLTECRFVRCEIGAEQRTDGFAADNVDPFLQIADAYDLEALSYTRNGCFRYAQPGFEQLRLEYLQEHSLAIEDNVEHLFGGNIELPTPCYPSAGGVLLFQIRSAGRLTARAGGEASFKLLRPPQREGTNLRKFLPPP